LSGWRVWIIAARERGGREAGDVRGRRDGGVAAESVLRERRLLRALVTRGLGPPISLVSCLFEVSQLGESLLDDFLFLGSVFEGPAMWSFEKIFRRVLASWWNDRR
jgi:hypothetical protein